jgi:hypothetical protein
VRSLPTLRRATFASMSSRQERPNSHLEARVSRLNVG